jgi:hypothetical protein
LQKIDRLIGKPIHKTVFLRYASRPTSAEHMLQWLRLSRAFERVPHDSVDKIENSNGNRPLVLDPEAKILKKLSLKN